jgi:hypothetical protein
VSRIHYGRLVEAALLHEHELILECYHPTTKLTTPWMSCDPLGTEGLEETALNPTLKGMRELYTRFRPRLDHENKRPRARYPTKAVDEGVEPPVADLASHDVQLDAAESFSQLCTVINLIKVGPKKGLFLSCVNVIEGVIRIWRDWLAEQASTAISIAEGKQRRNMTTSSSSILWTDQSSMNYGIRVRVVGKEDIQGPILVGADEDKSVSYVLEYEGK